MLTFFSASHANPQDHFWGGVYFHGFAENEVAARLKLVEGAADLVACAAPLYSRTLGGRPTDKARRILDTIYHQRAQAATPCLVYGLHACLYLWFDDARGDAHGLICLMQDNAAREYAFKRFTERAAIL
jgi:hypothetical protein